MTTSKKNVSTKRPRVLLSFGAPTPESNPFLSSFARSLGPDTHVEFFSWRAALFGRYNVFHLHWPELLVRSGNGRLKALKKVVLRLFLLRLKIGRIPTIWTVHNLAPHESLDSDEIELLRQVEDCVSYRVYLHPGAGHESTTSEVILHGDYREWAEQFSVPVRQQSKQILYFGQVRPYKGVESLVRAFNGAKSASWTLVIAGKPNSTAYADELRSQIDDPTKVTTVFRHLPDEELVRTIVSSTLVVLPYERMYNSGSAILALSLNRPILVPDTDATRSLQEEFGSSWVQIFEGTITADHLRAGLDSARSINDADVVDTSAREWSAIGAQYRDLYARLTSAPEGAQHGNAVGRAAS